MNKSNPVPISKRLVLINSISGIATRVLTVGVFAWVIQYLLKRIPEEELALLSIVLSLAMILPVLQTILTGGFRDLSRKRTYETIWRASRGSCPVSSRWCSPAES